MHGGNGEDRQGLPYNTWMWFLTSRQVHGQLDSYYTCFMFAEWEIDMSTLPHKAWSR